MNLTFEQKPVNTTSKVPVITNWTPIIGYMVLNDAISGLFYFKLILEVRLDDASGTLIAKMKQRRNGYTSDITNNRARAFFDLRDTVNSQLVNTVFDQNPTGTSGAQGVPFQTIHKLGANNYTSPAAFLFSVNGDRNTDQTQIQKIFVKAYQQYSSSESAIPTEDLTPTVNDTLWYLQASLPLMTARSTDANYVQSNAFNVYNASGSTDLFLSDVEQSVGSHGVYGYVNYVRNADYHTVAFLNDNANFDSHIDKIRIIYYTSAGASINSTDINNVSGNGGEAPTDGSLTDAERLIYFGCGTANLEAQTVSGASNAKPSNNSNWAYYTIQGMDGSSNAMTSLYYFINQDGSCKGFKVRRLAWRNSVGGYDYFNFKMKSTQTTNVQRDNYSSMLGTFNKSKWRYNNTQRGKTTRQTTATLSETLNTDWLTEQDANLLEKLIMSTDAYIVENADTDFTQAVMVKDSTFVKKTVANDKLIKYTINIEYANPVNTNS